MERKKPSQKPSLTGLTGSDVRASNRWWTSNIAIAICLFALVVLLAMPHFPYTEGDSGWYMMMAGGEWQNVPKPWAARILHPLVASQIVGLVGVDVETAFVAVSFIYFMIFISLIVPQWRKLELTPGYLALPALLMPFLIHLYQTIFMPDLFHATITAIFFWFLMSERNVGAATLMLVLIGIRESSLALGLITVMVGVLRREWRFSALVLGSTIAGYVAVKFIVASVSPGVQNAHDMPELVYLATKLPANFLHNIVGIAMYTNTVQWCVDPIATVNVPAGFGLGAIREIGFCKPNPWAPLRTATVLSTLFGVLPGIIAAVVSSAYWRKPIREVLNCTPRWMVVAFCYGLFMWLVGPLSGKSVHRLAGYAWPLFLLVAPALLATSSGWTSRLRLVLVGAHALALWPPFIIGHTHHLVSTASEVYGSEVYGMLFLIGLSANVAVFFSIRKALLHGELQLHATGYSERDFP
jgi:hypothetical protein